jgi:hypothetical protein
MEKAKLKASSSTIPPFAAQLTKTIPLNNTKEFSLYGFFI